MSSLRARANALAARLPDPIADRVLPGRRRAIAQHGTTSVAAAERRLFIGPVNSAGQGFAWARAAERLPGVAAADFMYRNAHDPFRFEADHSVPTTFFVSSVGWQRRQRHAVARGFTHVMLESGRHLFGTDGDVVDQIDWMRRKGLDVALLWHGSDIRLPSANAATEADSPFAGGRYHETERLEVIARANRRVIEVTGAPVFVSTPDLLTSVPGATWLPVVVEPERWAQDDAPLGRERPIVVHAPSNAGLKGSELISGPMHELDRAGLIEYRELRNVPASSMPEVYGEADIVLDQFALGIYGVAACEALAAGRVVVSHVASSTRAHVRRTAGVELPIVESTAGELEATIHRILGERPRFQAIAAAGPGFVTSLHDGRRSAEALRSFLDLGVSGD